MSPCVHGGFCSGISKSRGSCVKMLESSYSPVKSTGRFYFLTLRFHEIEVASASQIP